MKSFLHGKKSVSMNALVPNTSGPAPAGVPGVGERKAPVAQAAAQPTVEVVREGDKVVRVFVTCACGERIELECLYPAGV
jgi:hypothetical protein